MREVESGRGDLNVASGLSWFKFRVDAHSHPKLRALSDGEFRLLTYVWTLAQASSVPGLVRLTESMGVAPADLAAGAGCGRKGKPEAMLARLQELGLILVCELGIITVHDWEEHNGRPPSWQPTARAAQKRKERSKPVAMPDVATMSQVSQGLSQASRNDVRRVDQEEEIEEEKEEETQRGADAPAQPSIEELQSDWPAELLERVKLAVTSTRKSGQMAEGPWRAFLLSAKQYSPGLRVRASETYLDGAMAGEGKGERYLLGIMRGEHTRLQQPLRANGAPRGAVLSISEDAKKEHDIPGRKMVSGQ